MESVVVTVSSRAEGVVLKERRTLSWRVHRTVRANGRDALSKAIAVDVEMWCRLINHLLEGDLDLDFRNSCGQGNTPERQLTAKRFDYSISTTTTTMASRRVAGPAKHLFAGFRSSQRNAQPCLVRSMATEAPLPNATLSKTYIDAELDSAPTEPFLKDEASIPPATPSQAFHQTPQAQTAPRNPFLSTTSCTLYQFPSMEPSGFASYPSTHLAVPLRRDLLHRAVIYEGDMTRQGTASTKTRYEVHGSNRKIRPQKGTGSARLGDKKSPMLKGGGVAFGPKPRDFSTELPKKVYDRAWRTALSYRYKMGQMIVVDGEAEVDVSIGSLERYTKDMLRYHNFGHNGGRTLFVTAERRDNLAYALRTERMGREARAVEVDYVDVKDLLEMGRIIVERDALEEMFFDHESDLGPNEKLGAWSRILAEQNGEEGMYLEA